MRFAVFYAIARRVRNLLSRRLLVTTETLDSDIAALAMVGDSGHPAYRGVRLWSPSLECRISDENRSPFRGGHRRAAST
jgi:hypothetical protein